MKFFCRSVISIVVAVLSSQASATSESELDELYQKLRQVPISYQTFGTVCEQIARIELIAEYPADKFEIVTGILYKGKDEQGSYRTLGELDVVVLDKSDNEAIIIAEVKCWKDLDAARSKARKQLKRFAHYMQISTNLTMYLTENIKRHFKMQQFDEQPKYLAVSQDDGKEHGFGMTIGVSLDEASALRDKLLSWQNRHPPTRQNP